ncbi:MAG: 2-amino-4-hydroxy-6-hydroxymethyldihydropteridine diphosphokinase [Tannerellaceae bacterium]|jgi:2-amino-4-hydroxy-6-hydroxymethyldihydropteridine diphosphokinase|nr:2-amino-4-hydroxy-6-hydroxymethyldihydropteridine diphosphokinase [Tannerellaceae bacterium]
MATVYIGLGTNLGDKNKHITTAVKLLAERAGKILALSRLYENPPWGFESENEFINAALALETVLSPLELLNITQQIEREMGRSGNTSGSYCDRIIDIDILLYEDMILHTDNITLPHPLMHERRFVAVPLAEIAPALLHPVLKKTMASLALSL